MHLSILIMEINVLVIEVVIYFGIIQFNVLHYVQQEHWQITFYWVAIAILLTKLQALKHLLSIVCVLQMQWYKLEIVFANLHIVLFNNNLLYVKIIAILKHRNQLIMFVNVLKDSHQSPNSQELTLLWFVKLFVL